jgi:hypothetical protein
VNKKVVKQNIKKGKKSEKSPQKKHPLLKKCRDIQNYHFHLKENLNESLQYKNLA